MKLSKSWEVMESTPKTGLVGGHLECPPYPAWPQGSGGSNNKGFGFQMEWLLQFQALGIF